MCSLCVYVRLKSVIASDNQENDKSENAAFFQILIAFYIQSEVLSALYSNHCNYVSYLKVD